jgi:ribosomal protein S18 acetylase RimI-like enzyme
MSQREGTGASDMHHTAPQGAATTPPSGPGRRARPEERPAVLAILRSAFQDDPLYRWLYPDTAVRADRLRPLFELMLDAAFRHDAVWVLDDLSAAAVHAHHPGEVISTDVVDRYVERLSTTLGPSRTLAVTEAMASCADFSPSAPHEVLHSIAVPPHARGRGAGSALLRHLLDRCDQRASSVYLESSNLRNLSLYRRHGFRPLGTVLLPGGESPMTPMLRAPSP